MALKVYALAIEMPRKLRPVLEAVAKKDPSLADQLRRAAASVPLNRSEGSYSLQSVDVGLRDELDRIVATVYRLVRR